MVAQLGALDPLAAPEDGGGFRAFSPGDAGVAEARRASPRVPPCVPEAPDRAEQLPLEAAQVVHVVDDPRLVLRVA